MKKYLKSEITLDEDWHCQVKSSVSGTPVDVAGMFSVAARNIAIHVSEHTALTSDEVLKLLKLALDEEKWKRWRKVT